MENNNLPAHPLELPAALSSNGEMQALAGLWLLGCAHTLARRSTAKVRREAREVAIGCERRH